MTRSHAAARMKIAIVDDEPLARGILRELVAAL
jgi:hypothetical protein